MRSRNSSASAAQRFALRVDSSLSPSLADFSQVDMWGVRYRSVKFWGGKGVRQKAYHFTRDGGQSIARERTNLSFAQGKSLARMRCSTGGSRTVEFGLNFDPEQALFTCTEARGSRGREGVILYEKTIKLKLSGSEFFNTHSLILLVDRLRVGWLSDFFIHRFTGA